MSWTVSATANQHSSAFDHRSPLKPKRGKNTLITWLRWFDHTACQAHTHILKPLYFRFLMKVFYFLQLKSSVVCTGLAINSSNQTDSIQLTTWRGFCRKYELHIFRKFAVVFLVSSKTNFAKNLLIDILPWEPVQKCSKQSKPTGCGGSPGHV